MPAPIAAGRAPRLVKRYRNRKFYDTLECRYVRLEELALVIAGGADVRVVEHDGDRDITQATLFALLGQREREAPSLEPDALHDLVRGVLGDLAPGGDGGEPASEPTPGAGVEAGAAARLAELLARGERLRAQAEASWAASQARAEALRAELQAGGEAAWAAVGALGKVNRELRRLRGEIDALSARLDGAGAAALAGR